MAHRNQSHPTPRLTGVRTKRATLLALVVLVSACTQAPNSAGPTTTESPGTNGSTTTELPEPRPDIPRLADLTRTYGCGYGFWLGNGDHTVALRLEFAFPLDAPDTYTPHGTATLPDSSWSGRLFFGTDLYSNWCDDVIEDDEPTPVETGSMPITGGTITWILAPRIFDGGPAAIAVDDLEATTLDGESVPLGSGQITNGAFGLFAN